MVRGEFEKNKILDAGLWIKTKNDTRYSILDGLLFAEMSFTYRLNE